MADSRTIFDLSEEEYEDYSENPDDPKWGDVTDNTLGDAYTTIFPDGDNDEDDDR